MNKKFKKFLAISSLILAMVLAFTACNDTGKKPGKKDDEKKNTTPLVVGYDEFSEKFSPFFATSGYDQDVAEITGITLMVTDRVGGIVYNSIKGETRKYNGTDYTYKGISDIKVDIDEANNKTKYTIKIRDDVKFSDGHVLDADDIIFSYYVLADSTYTGGTTLYSQPIIGMKNYRANNSNVESLDASDIAEGMAAIPTDKDLQNVIAEKVIKAVLTSELDWVSTVYTDASLKEAYKDAIAANPDRKDLFNFFYGLDENYDSKSKDEATVLADIIAQYGYDYETLGSAYAGDATYFTAQVQDLITPILASRLGATEEVPNITGIKKLSQTEVEVTTYGYDATAIYQIGGIIVAPMHYYGDESKYDYANNKFGFDRNDLSIVEAKTTKPLGAGPYKFIKYENKVVYFEANTNYWKGEPKIGKLQFKETQDADKVSGIKTGAIDITDPSGSKDRFAEIAGYNTNKELSGDVITTNRVDNLGYGYIGINSNKVNVGGKPDSAESKNLRRAFATMFSVYRDLSIDSYYGDAASVINYPISNTSWAAPQKSDDGYEIAYSRDVAGNQLYTQDMKAADKYAKALEAAVGFFKAAGYTYDEGTKKFTAAPNGAAMDYEVIVAGDGTGDHPSFMIMSEVKKALETIGITLVINDPTDSNVLWDALDAGEQEMWVAAWQATIDPDMYQVYHSSNIVGKGGTNSNHYAINDTELDELILEARTSADQVFRKTTYKACLDIILDWAVEIPVYQRQNCIIFSSERVNLDTVTPDITTYWDWSQDIELLEMK